MCGRNSNCLPYGSLEMLCCTLFYRYAQASAINPLAAAASSASAVGGGPGGLSTLVDSYCTQDTVLVCTTNTQVEELLTVL